MDKFCRTKTLIGDENFNKLTNVNLCVFGVGGVGGFVAEYLVRCGVQNLTIVDFDKVEYSNFNRQIIGIEANAGKNKVDVLKNRLLEINSDINIDSINEKLTTDNIENFNLCNYDYIIDCIDDVKAKFSLIQFCSLNKIPIICAMGSGNRFDIPQFKIMDIYETTYDGLAKKIRQLCKKNNIRKLTVACSVSQPKKLDGVIGSIAYYPPACASCLVAYVVNKLIER